MGIKVLSIFGTRPEAIKMAPVIKCLRDDDGIISTTCVTGQHRAMLDNVLELFGIKPDFDLDVMSQGQTLNSLSSKVISGLDAILEEVQPDCVLVHGDTTTAMCASVAAFHRGIKVGHVEAGLRTYDLGKPFPEEMNRRVIDMISSVHFAPTDSSANNLSEEKLGGETIITGNTVIDALLETKTRIQEDVALQQTLNARFPFINGSRKTLLVTGHRRESFGDGFVNICKALAELAMRPDLTIIYPVHLNPNVRGPVHEFLDKATNVHLLEPQAYLEFVYLMDRSNIIMTDSGGVQEEALSFGKPVLVMRDVTERPEAVDAGSVKLVGTDTQRITDAVTRLLDDAQYRDSFARIPNPYGDGKASERITAYLAGRSFKPFVGTSAET